MSFILLGILNSSGAGRETPYWLATLGGTGNDILYSMAKGTDTSFYVGGQTDSTGAGGLDVSVAKYNSSGTIEWQRVLGGLQGDFVRGVGVDSSNNSYFAGLTASSGAGENDALIAKYNSSGTIQWQKTLGGTGFDAWRAAGIDSSNNLYVTGEFGAPVNAIIVAKYNSTGVIQWQKSLETSADEYGKFLAIDSSDNVYIGGVANLTGSQGYDFILAKYNSSGTIQWQRTLGGTGTDDGAGIAIDSSDNVYVTGVSNSVGAGGLDLLLAKYNSSGTIQWQRVLGGSSRDAGKSIAIDSSDNVYVGGETESDGEGGRDFLLAKYNSSGTIQWQRTLGGTGNEEVNALFIDAQGILYAGGLTTSTGEGGNDFLIAKIPTDGSLTGTYVLDGVNIIYAASTLTAATSSLASSTSSLTAATSTLVGATSSLTDASSSLTSHFVEIPA